MHTIDTEIEYLTTLIEQRIRQSYLDKFIQKPVIDHEKMIILMTILDSINIPSSRREKYIVTTMLVQAALDTHDLVADENSTNSNYDNNKTKQLTVLAGDYYSGLYYFLLANIEDTKFINILATAIKEINENKMKLYYYDGVSFEDFFNLIKRLESLLFIHVADFVNQGELIPIIEEWLLTSKLMKESNMAKDGYSSLAKLWLKNTDQKAYIKMLEVMDERLVASITETKAILAQIPTQHLLLKDRISTILANFNNNTSKVEEG